MNDHLHSISEKASSFLRWVLFAYAVFIGIETGAGAFTTVVVFPAWAASPEAAIGWRPEIPYYLEEGDFFMFSSSLTTLAAIAALIASWRAPSPLRLWTRLASISFLLVAVWSAVYFIPIQDTTFKGAAGAKIPRAVLASGLQMFVVLNYVRQVIILFALITALHALGLSYRTFSRNSR